MILCCVLEISVRFGVGEKGVDCQVRLLLEPFADQSELGQWMARELR